MNTSTEFAALIEPVARRLLGEPNAHLSKGDQLRSELMGPYRWRSQARSRAPGSTMKAGKAAACSTWCARIGSAPKMTRSNGFALRACCQRRKKRPERETLSRQSMNIMARTTR